MAKTSRGLVVFIAEDLAVCGGYHGYDPMIGLIIIADDLAVCGGYHGYDPIDLIDHYCR